MGKIPRKTIRLRRGLAAFALAAAVSPVLFTTGSSAAPVGQGFTVTPSDLSHILRQIKIAEAHVQKNNEPGFLAGPDGILVDNPATPVNEAADNRGICDALVGNGPNQIGSPLVAEGLRTVDGSCNNLIHGQEHFGGEGQIFPRLTTPVFKDAEGRPADFFGPGDPGSASSSYTQKKGSVFDSQPRLISNLIVDQTSTNPAAVSAARNPVRTQGNPGVEPCVTDPSPAFPTGDPADCTPSHHTLFIPNVTTDVGLSPPFNGLFTIFGQFFDHGVDKTAKGGSGTVFVPLRADDPLIAGPDHIFGNADDLPASLRFMPLTRATNQPGPDGILGDPDPAAPDTSLDDIQDANNTDTPFVDQSQTYTSHPSHQVFLREYTLTAGKPVATGKLIHSPDDPSTPTVDESGAQANWKQVKAQAATMLGFQLRDKDVLDVPMVAADLYGNFIPGPHGFPQYVTTNTDPALRFVEGDPTANGGLGVTPPADVVHFQISFLDDIAHSAAPNPGLSPDPDSTAGTSLDTPPAGTYDDELLDLHFIGGDGRLNENIALTAVHQIFHSEHDRLVDDIEATLALPENAPLATAYHQTSATTFGYGERLFQAARFVTEMEYQHLVFEEFGRKVQPLINPFAGFAFTQTNINPAVKAEFAHAVYRFGHSMLTEDIDRINEDGTHNDIPLLDGFLNPAEFTKSTPNGPTGALNPKQAAGAILMGMSDQVGNEIDEFVTETLRNNLLGLPLDLPTINMTRARSEGIPPLNELRRQLYATTNDSQLKPYTNWIDYGLHLKHPESLINFVAAYGTHPSITSVSTIADKREAARILVDPLPTDTVPADAGDFLNGPAATSGLDNVDLWVGGLAERTNLFGGLLGSTFNYVFESQMTDLQNSDRLYYLARTPGMNLRSQLEGNSFAELVMRNTTAHSLKADAFGTADCKFQLANLTFIGTNTVNDDPTTDCDEHALLIRMADGTIRYRTTNSVDPPGINGQSVYNGTSGPDRIFGGVDNDTFLGNEGNDVIEGSDGADVALGGEGNDIITDNAGDDVLKGGPGNDAMEAGPGLDILLGGNGKDFMNGGANINDSFGGADDDFMILGQGEDVGQGDSGDDWMEGGDQPDLLQGDSGALFFNDPNKPGHDIFIGQAGDDDYDAEGGDDIMVADAGIEKNAGAAGYDFSTGAKDVLPQDADLALKIVAPDVPITAIDVRDRFNEVEGLSGGKFNDILRGDSIVPRDLGGAGAVGCDALDQASLDRISGLDEIVPPLTPQGAIVANSQTHDCPLVGNIWGDGNILLGGAGSDTIEGRGANDIIDGDRYLNVRLSVRTNPNDPNTEIGTTDLMENTYQTGNTHTLQQDVMAGVIDPGNIVAVREILTPTTGLGVDTAVFSAARADFTITPNPDGSITVAHTAAAGGGGGGGGLTVDNGIDTLRNIELLQFTDTTMPVPGGGGPANVAATGTPSISGVPQAGIALTAANGSIADTDGINLVSFAWEQEGPANVWTQVATGSSFTPGPGSVGNRLRVVATVLDNLGGVTTGLASTPTAAVAPGAVTPGNLPATGTPVITDEVGVALAGRPRVALPVGVDTTGIADPNGLAGVVFNFQWQQSTDGGTTWTDISGATFRAFTPSAAQLGNLLRVHVFFVDNAGTLEQLDSAATRDVRPAKTKAGGPTVLVLGRATVPGTINAAGIATRGVSVTLTAPKTTTIVRIRVFRGTAKSAAATVFINVKPGTHKVKLRQASIMRVLKRGGKFRIEMTPGTNKTHLGTATVRRINVHHAPTGK